MRRDPGAAAFLAAHAAAFQQQEQPARSQRVLEQNKLDILKLHARMSKWYPWMSDSIALGMHYPRFFRYAREAQEMAEEERRASHGAPVHQNDFINDLHAKHMSNMATRPAMWNGEVVNVGR